MTGTMGGTITPIQDQWKPTTHNQRKSMSMSMSDCPKCWDTLCACGWEYRTWSKAKREDLAASALGVSVEKLRSVITTPEHHPLLDDEKWRNSSIIETNQ